MRSVVLNAAAHSTWVASACASLALSCEDPGDVSKEPVIVWQVPAQSAITAPLVLESVVVFGGSEGAVIALDRTTGETRWRRQLAQGEGRGSEIKGVDGLAVVPQWGLWALHAGRGKFRWPF